MSTPQVLFHKRGSRFSFAGTALLPAGTWSARSKIKQLVGEAFVDVATLVVTLTPPGTGGQPHAVLLEFTSDQSAWPLGPLRCDIAYDNADEAGADPLVSPTFVINIEPGVT